MTAHYTDATVTLHHGDCLDVLRELADCSVDSVVTDPPYGLGFMGKEWDSGKSFVERKPAKRNTFDHVGGNHNPTSSADAARTRRVESKRFGEWCELWAAECLRVLKPGGHLLAFGGTRTWHRLACAVEDAGFEVRDSIAWLYGSGFPKSLDVSKAIDKRAEENGETKRRIALVAEVIRTHREAKGMERAEVSLAVVGTPSGACWNWEHQQLPSVEMWPAIKRTLDIPDDFDGLIEGDRAQFIAAERAVLRERTMTQGGGTSLQIRMGEVREVRADITAPATPDAERWQGWGTALKPAFEPVVVARKPIVGTVAGNVLAHGTGALNIDGCRVPSTPGQRPRIEAWVNEPSRCASCAAPVELSARPTTPATRASTATRSAEPTTSARGEASQLDTHKTATGCSAGTKAGSTSTSSSTAESGKPQTAPSLTATSSTTGTTTDSTTGSRTCNSCGAAITSPTTQGSPTSTRTALEPRPSISGSTAGASAGRWPSNVVLDETQAAALDEQSGELTSGANPTRRGSDKFRDAYGDFKGQEECTPARGVDVGGASRFFYVAKADAAERPRVNGTAHPTVKPLALMRWLVRLVTPPGGTVLEPFAGSGTTVEACIVEGFRCIAIEKGAEYLPLIEARIARRRDPVRAIELNGEDMGLFGIEEVS